MWQMISPHCVEYMGFFNKEMKYKFFIPIRFGSSGGNRPMMITSDGSEWWSNGNKIIDEV